MKIDAHQHFWQYSLEDYGWISEEMAVLKRDFLPEDLAPLLQKSGYAGCVAVQARQSETETNFLLELAEKYSIVKGVVGWVDLQAENIADRLAFFAQHNKLKGIRHVVQAEPDERFLMRPAFLRGIGQLAQFNLTYDILIYPQHLPVATEFAGQFPNQPFVLDHIAKPFIKAKKLAPWNQHLQALAQRQNVFCKLSGMVTEADWHKWKPEDLQPYLDTVLEAFGPDRLMIGSDWPVCTVAGSYSEVMQVVEEYIQKLSESEQEKILGGNAIKFYNLTPEN